MSYTVRTSGSRWAETAGVEMETMASTPMMLDFVQFRETSRLLGAIERLPRSLELAEIAVLSFSELLERLSRTWNDPQRKLIIDRLLRLDWSDDEVHQLMRCLEQLAMVSPELTLGERSLVDRAI